MAGTATYNINKPTVAGDSGVWGGFLNTGMDTIDNEIARSRIPFVSPTYNVGGTTTCDLNQTTGARVFVFTVSGASTLAFSNVPSASFDCRISLVISNGSAFALTFPASVTWLSGVAPTLKASGVDIIDLETKDAGTTWYATRRGPPTGVLYQNQGLSTTSTTEVSLASYSLPANTLVVNGQQLRITATARATTQTCTPVIKFGATGLLSGITILAGDVVTWTILLVRTGAATQTAYASFVKGSNVAATERNTPTETLSGAVTIDFRGLVNIGGTLNYDSLLIEYLTT